MKTLNCLPYDFEPWEPDKVKWYRWARFPLLPIFGYKSMRGFNTALYSFSWLFFRFWTLDAPEIDISLSIDNYGGRIRIKIPYCQFVIQFLWFSVSWDEKIFKYLWRKSRATQSRLKHLEKEDG